MSAVVRRELKLSYSIVERFGRANVEIELSNGTDRVVVHHAQLNPHYRSGPEEAAWGIVVDKIGQLLKDIEDIDE